MHRWSQWGRENKLSWVEWWKSVLFFRNKSNFSSHKSKTLQVCEEAIPSWFSSNFCSKHSSKFWSKYPSKFLFKFHSNYPSKFLPNHPSKFLSKICSNYPFKFFYNLNYEHSTLLGHPSRHPHANPAAQQQKLEKLPLQTTLIRSFEALPRLLIAQRR